MVNQVSLPRDVVICEVAPRDGFQSIPDFIPTENKIEIVNRLIDTGIQSLEISSFVHPRAIPQLKDAQELVAAVLDRAQEKEVDVRALVPNLRGAERAFDSGVRKVKTMLSATDSHSLSNANAKVVDAQEKLLPIFDFAQGHNMEVMGSISVAFGCPFEGQVPIERLVEIIQRYDEHGVKEISLADTTGMAQPKQVYESLAILQEAFPHMHYSMHFHNTRGMALANIFAALQRGVVMFDSSIAGLGGCPYAPGATGNVATEDVVHMLEEMGIRTGLQLDELIDTAKEVLKKLQLDGDSYMLKAGPSNSLSCKPTGQEKQGN